MPTNILANRVKVATATVGTGTVTLGAASSNAFCTFGEGGITDGQQVTYCIEESLDFEIGRGVYTAAAEDFGKQGVSSLDFGAFPGATDATVVVTGQSAIQAGSIVEAWIMPAATADHSVDEHWLDPPIVVAGNIAAGTGFTIYGRVPNDPPPEDDSYRRLPNVRNLRTYGVWNVAWQWT
jgi:hypothetical protein